jgi:hypothetical protein
MAASGQHDNPADGSIVYHEHPAPSLMVKRRIREATDECAKLARARARDPAAHGQLTPQIRAIAAARNFARTQHGPAQRVALVDVRTAYLSMGASCILLAERADRPKEPPRGERLKAKRSSVPGVYWDEGPSHLGKRRWRARVWTGETSKHLGHFLTEEEAGAAVEAFKAQRKLAAA